jgi:MYXO-CTERM domain-containing protein
MKAPACVCVTTIACALLLPATQSTAAPAEPVVWVKKLLAAKASGASDRFGHAVAIDGDRLAVGAPLDDDKAQDAGAVYIFERNRGGADNWGLAKKLTAPNGAAGDYFGYSVTLEAGRVAVGAVYHGGSPGHWRGSVYLFESAEGGTDNWGLVKELTPAATADERFGFAVELDGDLVVVAAVDHRVDAEYAGAVYVFRQDRGGVRNWGLAQTLLSEARDYGGEFGWSIAIRGSQLLVGAISANGNHGAAYLFAAGDGSRESWSQLKRLVVDGAVGDYFGSSVAVDAGDVIAVSSSTQNSVYIYGRDQDGPDAWGQVKRIVPASTSTQKYLVSWLSLHGQLLFVSASFDDLHGSISGSSYLFARDVGGAENWGVVQKFTAPDNASGDTFGYAGALSGNTLVLGAPGDDDLGSQSGSVHVFRLINTDDCTPNPCLNGAICADGLDTFSCHCARGYTGSTCASDVDECMGTPSPCHVDAVCTNVPGSFQCACKPGFQGDGSTCTPIPPPPPDAASELPDAGAGPDATTVSPADADSGDVDPRDLPGAGPDATTKPPEDAGIGADAPADGNGVVVDGASLDQAATPVEAGAADGPRDVVTPQFDGAAGDTALSSPDGGAGDGSSDGSHSPPTSDGCSCSTTGHQSGAWPFFIVSLFLGVARRRHIRRRDG